MVTLVADTQIFNQTFEHTSPIKIRKKSKKHGPRNAANRAAIQFLKSSVP